MTRKISDDDLIHMYTRQGRGFSDQQMADHFGVRREAIFRRRQKLEVRYPFKETEPGRYRIDTNRIISHIPVSPGEALVLFSFLRRSGRSTPFPKRYVKEALNKLAPALYKPMTEQLVQVAAKTLEHPDDASREAMLEMILTAWTEKRAIRLKYQALHRKDDTVWHTVSPYLIEPSPWSDSIYLIGYSADREIIIAFSLERIEKVVETSEPFRECDPGTEEQILKHAWGIWHSNRNPEIVRLRFTGYRAVRRLRESVWHPDESVDGPDDYSYAIWQAPIADWREMLPWIRGWGANVKVEGPEGLREELEKTALRLGKLYHTITTSTKQPHQLPYAKTNPDNRAEIHLLLYHLIDVGQVALIMWQEVLTDSIRQDLAALLNLTVDQTGRFVAFLAALHDLGKAGPAYQQKYAPEWLKKELQDTGLGLTGLGKAYDKTTPHGTVSTWALLELLPEMVGLERAFAHKIAVAIGGHHGSWPPLGAEDGLDDSKYELWTEVRRELIWEVRSVFQPPQAVPPPADKTGLNTFLTLLSGLVSVADWLGSRNKECFDFVERPMTTRAYAARSVQRARAALADLGWLGWQPAGETVSFAEAFAYLEFKEPRGVQGQVIAAANTLKPPVLLILEAPTGIGKTETALYLADAWLQQQAGRGLYVAMPTQATSNQMYKRIGDFLNHRYPDISVNYHLVHGQAAWQDELKKKVELQRIGDDDKTSGVQAESWFMPRKRTLLAPFGVGTVDQTFMSILQTRHFFVRLFGLSHKVIIFDEVHAYDTFMNTLFERLLTWLNAIGTSVIILSATLPAETRRKLVEAYSGQPLTQSGEYPSLTIAASGHESAFIELPQPAEVTVQLAWEVGREPNEISDYLRQELANGGCAAIICNTVRRAQDIFRALDAARQKGTLDLPEDDLILFHARFPPVWRQVIEQKVLAKFGKPDESGRSPNRPRRAIVVATQVIEQSLDLDFDLMLTDLAPIDLIIQRAGRLHRHERSEAERHGLERRLVITEPAQDEAGLPRFESDQYVYQPYILLRSYLALQGQTEINTPGDTTGLIEAVYEDLLDTPPLPLAWQEALQEARRKMDRHRDKAEARARRQLILAPDNRRLLRQSVLDLDEESPDVHETFRAQTRDIDPGISLICLHRAGEQVFIYTKDDIMVVNLEGEIPREVIKQLQQNMITVQHKGLVHHFVDIQPPASWQKEAALRHCRPVIFEDGFYNDHPKYILRLSPTLGLEIIKKEDV